MDTVEKRSCPFLSKNKFVKCLVNSFFFSFLSFELSVCLLSRVRSVSNAECKREKKNIKKRKMNDEMERENNFHFMQL
jgi:hypothetical protein